MRQAALWIRLQSCAPEVRTRAHREYDANEFERWAKTRERLTAPGAASVRYGTPHSNASHAHRNARR